MRGPSILPWPAAPWVDFVRLIALTSTLTRSFRDPSSIPENPTHHRMTYPIWMSVKPARSDAETVKDRAPDRDQ
jgi:hypothetical protein